MKDRIFKALISFITGAILAAVIFALAGIYPGSEKTLLIFDMREQFVSFYSSLKSLVSGDSSFFYTFQGSLGTHYLGMFAYYLASPFSLITLLFDTRDLPDAIWLMDILKCGAMCASFSVFMDHRGVKDNFYNLFLSICYALSSAAVTFFILPMYSDTLIWLPVICIFLERLLEKPYGRNGLLYSVCLAGCMYTHYYSAYMVCIFLIFYSIWLCPSLKKYTYFIVYSLLATLLASPLLIPVAKELASGKVNDVGVYSDGSFIVTSPWELLKQFICGHYGYLYSEGAPSVYFTVIALVLAIFGLYMSRRDKEKLISSIVIVLVFLGSFTLRPLYRIWHMFRDPVAYPHRFAFLFLFFMLVLAGDGVKALKDNRRVSVAALVFGSSLLVFNGYRLTTMEIQTLPSATRSEYEIFIDTTADLVEYAKEDCINSGNLSLCRINKDYEFTSNDPMLLGFNGMDYFASVYDPAMLKFYKNLGFLQYHYKACDAGDTILTGMMLGTDYLIHKGYVDDGFEMLTSNGFSTLCRNPYSLGVGYLASPDTCEFGADPFANQNNFVNSVMGEDTELLKPVEYTVSNRTIVFTAPAGENVYLNFELLNESELDYEAKSNSEDIDIVLDGRIIASFTGFQKSYNVFVGCFAEDTECRILVDGVKEIRQPYIYSFDPDRLRAVYESISEGCFAADSIGPDYIHGTVMVSALEKNTLVLTVSYSDDLEVYVDGVRVKAVPYAGALLSIPDLTLGEHEIKIDLRH